MVSYQSAKDEIKRAANVVELIGQYVKLRKTGRNYSGLCPFHAEKDPSFSVNPERQSFHCFGCKKGISHRVRHRLLEGAEGSRELRE